MIGMGAFCVGCKTKNSTGIRTAADLEEQYPEGCFVCSRAKSEGTRSALRAKIQSLGYAFVDMEDQPIVDPSP